MIQLYLVISKYVFINSFNKLQGTYENKNQKTKYNKIFYRMLNCSSFYLFKIKRTVNY